MSKVKVVVRARPLNEREKKLKTPCVCLMQDTQTILRHPKTKEDKVFNFDRSFWSVDDRDPHFAEQADVYEDVGGGVLENAFKGYNACIFAYGQTGSGKTHTMMGAPSSSGQQGIIPRLCNQIFQRIEANDNPNLTFRVEVSYMEIYNEKVKDLLKPAAGHKLKVRQHKVLGPYVEGLSKLAVTSFRAIEVLMAEGNKVRTTAATKMNDTSSRSHAVFTLILTQAQYDAPTKQTGEKVSRLSLVDLAGSERHGKTGTSGARLKEGANINKSLTTLGLVIKALADADKSKKGGGKSSGSKPFVPYRNSTLTWLLKDNLGGNSKTVMVATISPALDNYEESLSTLRYAYDAKRIVNHAVVNEDPNARLIRELREELEALRKAAGSGGGGGGGADTAELEEYKHRLQETEGLLKEMTQTWEEKLKETESLLEQKQKLLDEHHASVTQGSSDQGLKVKSSVPHFIRISDIDIEILTLKEGLTLCGRAGADPPQDIILVGEDIDKEHAIISFDLQKDEAAGCLIEVLTLYPVHEEEPNCFVNGIEVDAVNGTRLTPGCDVKMGALNVFRFNHPTEALRLGRLGQLPGAGDTGVTASAGVLNPAREIEKKRRKEEEARREEEEEKLRKFMEEEKMAVEAEKERLAAELAAITAASQAEKERLATEAAAATAEREAAAQRERAAREAKEREMAEAAAQHEAMLQKMQAQMAALQAQVAEHEASAKNEQIRREAAERESALLSEREAEGRERVRLEAARAAEVEAQANEARKQAELEQQAIKNELLRREQELIQKEEDARLEAERKLQEANDRLAEEQKKQLASLALVEQTKLLMAEEAQRERDEAVAQAKREAHEELMRKEAEALAKQRQQEEAMRRRLEEAESVLMQERARADAEMGAKAKEMAQMEQETLDEQRRLQKAAADDIARKERELRHKQEEFEREAEARKAAEEQTRKEKLFREVEEAQAAKDLAEQEEKQRKAAKNNIAAREQWMQRMGLGSGNAKATKAAAGEEESQRSDQDAEAARAAMERDLHERRKRVEEAKRAREEAEAHKQKLYLQRTHRRESSFDAASLKLGMVLPASAEPTASVTDVVTEISEPEREPEPTPAPASALAVPAAVSTAAAAAVAEVAIATDGATSTAAATAAAATVATPSALTSQSSVSSVSSLGAASGGATNSDSRSSSFSNNPFLSQDVANNPFLEMGAGRSSAGSVSSTSAVDFANLGTSAGRVGGGSASSVTSRSEPAVSALAAARHRSRQLDGVAEAGSLLPPPAIVTQVPVGEEDAPPLPPKRGVSPLPPGAFTSGSVSSGGSDIAAAAAAASAAAAADPRRSHTVGAKPDVDIQIAAGLMRMMKAQNEWAETKARAQKNTDKASRVMGEPSGKILRAEESHGHGHGHGHGAKKGIKKLAGKVWKSSRHERLDS